MPQYPSVVLHLAGRPAVEWPWESRPLRGEYIAAHGKLWLVRFICRGPESLHAYCSRVRQVDADELLRRWNGWCAPAEAAAAPPVRCERQV
jgi:hypothetical protein